MTKRKSNKKKHAQREAPSDYRYPECGQQDRFFVAVAMAELVGDDLWDCDGEDWGDASPCVCPECGWIGELSQVSEAHEEAK